MMPGRGGGGLGAADEGGWRVIYSKLNRGASGKTSDRKMENMVWTLVPSPSVFCDS